MTSCTSNLDCPGLEFCCEGICCDDPSSYIDLGIGVIIAIVVVIFVCITGCVVAVCCCCKRQTNQGYVRRPNVATTTVHNTQTVQAVQYPHASYPPAQPAPYAQTQPAPYPQTQPVPYPQTQQAPYPNVQPTQYPVGPSYPDQQPLVQQHGLGEAPPMGQGYSLGQQPYQPGYTAPPPTNPHYSESKLDPNAPPPPYTG